MEDQNLSNQSNFTYMAQDMDSEQGFENLKQNHIYFQKLQNGSMRVKNLLLNNVLMLIDSEDEIDFKYIYNNFQNDIEKAFGWIIKENFCTLDDICGKILFFRI